MNSLGVLDAIVVNDVKNKLTSNSILIKAVCELP